MKIKEKTKIRLMAIGIGALFPIALSYEFIKFGPDKFNNEIEQFEDNLFTEIVMVYWLCLKSIWTGRNEIDPNWLSEDEKIIKDIIE